MHQRTIGCEFNADNAAADFKDFIFRCIVLCKRQDLIRTVHGTVIRWSSTRNYTWKQQLTLAHHVLATAPKQFRRGSSSLDVRFNAHGPVNKRRLFPTNSITSRSRDYGLGRRAESVNVNR